MTEIWNLSTLCRCCHRDGSFKSLNMPCQGENGDEMYETLLKETLGINIIQPPEHLEASHTICDDCITRLRDATQFRQQVMVCEEKFKIYCTNEEFINEAACDDDNVKPLIEFNYNGFDDTSDIHRDDNLFGDKNPTPAKVKKVYQIEVDIEPVSDIKPTKHRKRKSKINNVTEKRVSKKEKPHAISSKRNIKLAQDDLLKYSSNYDDDNPEQRRDKIIYLYKQGHSKRIIAKALNMAMTKKSAEQIRQQKREYARKRRAFIKADPASYAAAKDKDRARYKDKTEKLQIKLVSDMTLQELCNLRKERRERKRFKSRLKKILDNDLGSALTGRSAAEKF